jgi:hypothetical protein
MILGPKTPSFKKNNTVATSILGMFFWVIYKPQRSHSMVDALSQMFDLT